MTPTERLRPEHRLLEAYDAPLREDAGMTGATRYDRNGPVWHGTSGSRGFVTYHDLGSLTDSALDELIVRTVTHDAADLSVISFEWKTRGHDLPADLPERLVVHGPMAEERETVMLGEAARLAVEVPLPPGVRQVDLHPALPAGDVELVQESVGADEEQLTEHLVDAGAVWTVVDGHPEGIEIVRAKNRALRITAASTPSARPLVATVGSITRRSLFGKTRRLLRLLQSKVLTLTMIITATSARIGISTSRRTPDTTVESH
jgi:hypothetical protein